MRGAYHAPWRSKRSRPGRRCGSSGDNGAMGRCVSCGQDNPGGFRFCGACGSPLAEVTRHQAGEERKVVTVVFCDLVGFTARSDRADPEDVGAMLRPFHARLRGEIERVGGTLDKLIGDAVMAVFGVPAVHEDDPERAVRCACWTRSPSSTRPVPRWSWQCGSVSTPARRWWRWNAAPAARAWSATWSTPPRGSRGWPR